MKAEETKTESTIHIAQAKLTSGDASHCCKQGALQGTQEMNRELALLIWEDDGGGWGRDDERQHNG